ncbi:uncharacterized protein LOC119189456 [Manduca sexta]|uniref:uncharacterized protein LOC119189456 n=1 Tax=Manduca sexta TaxID=7130 RepID=UPI00188F76A4|nr:uncharacterized protein LOC119189456 [Manduca sexta]
MWVSLFTCLHLFTLMNSQGLYTNELETERTSETPDTMYRSRCTRRFTPGVCEGSATTVWTFAFHTQNCTERLGCPLSHRTNRFRTYKQCMRRCRHLIDIYLQILTNDKYTHIFYLRNQADAAGRRDGDSIPIEMNNTLDLDDDKDEPSSSEEPLFNMYYRDVSEAEVSLPPDIDYVMGQENEDTSDYAYDD